jgi:hypothetical protein
MTTLYHTFAHPWGRTTLASWQKYPHPRRPDILNVELISKDVDHSVLKLQRLITIKYRCPAWMPSAIADSVFYCLETTVVDAEARTMATQSHNLSFQNLVSLKETCVYTPATEMDTKLIQTVAITAHTLCFKQKIETWFLNEYISTVELGRQIMDDAVTRVQT